MKTWTEWLYLFLVIGLLVGLAPIPAAAESSFANHIRSARQLLERQQYAQALEELARSKPLAGNDPLRGIVLALHSGFAFAQLGDSEQALAAFRAALTADPQARLPLLASPRLSREFEEIRHRVSNELLQAPADAPPVVQEAVLFAWVQEFPRPRPSLPPLDLSTRLFRPSIAAPAAVAVGMTLSSGVFWLLALNERSRLRNHDPSLLTPADVQRTVSRGKIFQALGVSLLGTGVLSLMIAAGQYVRREPDPRAAPSSAAKGSFSNTAGRP